MKTFVGWANDPKSVRRQRLKTLGIIIGLIGITIKHADKLQILVDMISSNS